MILAMEWVGTLMSFSGTALIAGHQVSGWWLCCLADVLLVMVAWRIRRWGFLALCGTYVLINAAGGVAWAR